MLVKNSNNLFKIIEKNSYISYNANCSDEYVNINNFRKTNSENVQTGAIETNSNSSKEYAKNGRTATWNDGLYNKNEDIITDHQTLQHLAKILYGDKN